MINADLMIDLVNKDYFVMSVMHNILERNLNFHTGDHKGWNFLQIWYFKNKYIYSLTVY